MIYLNQPLDREHPISHRNANRRGAVLPLLAMLLVPILTVLALFINVAWLQLKRTESQSASDLAVLCAVRHFGSHQDMSNLAETRTLAASLLRLNEDYAEAEEERILFGYVTDPNAHAPTFLEDETQINAAQVTPSLNPRPDRIPIFLNTFLNTAEFTDISCESVSTYPPIEFVLCLDASRSMNYFPGNKKTPGNTGIHVPPSEGSRWFELSATVENFLQQVKTKNEYARVALVTFGGGFTSDDHGRTASPLDEDYARTELLFQLAGESEVISVMDSYVDYPALGYATFIYDAIEDSVAVLRDHGNPKAARFIILLSDGQQWTGNRNFSSPRPAPWEAAIEANSYNIPIHTINFQSTSNQQLIDVAEVTGGSALQASDTVELNDAFAKLLTEFDMQLAK